MNSPGLDPSLAFRASRLPGNVQSGAAYTAAIEDIDRVIRFTGSAPAVLTIPTDAAAPFPIGTVLTIARDGTGAVAIAPASGVTINGLLNISAQFGLANLRKTDTNAWSAFGALA